MADITRTPDRPTTRHPGRPGTHATADKTPRYVNIALGAWLFISAFIWLTTPAQQTNNWILGLLVVGAAAWALFDPRVRFINTVLSVWLFVSVWVLPTQNKAVFWNNVLVAIAVFVLSLIPSAGRGPRRTTRSTV